VQWNRGHRYKTQERLPDYRVRLVVASGAFFW